MGTLLTGIIDFNNPEVVLSVRAALSDVLSEQRSYFPLEFRPSFYFHVPGNSLPSAAGWYIILDDVKSLYVGKAGNLANRLSSNHGSLDQFAKKARTSEPERNFIKKFIEIGLVEKPRVAVVELTDLSDRLRLESSRFSNIDIANIEKYLNIIRHQINYVGF